MDGNKHSQNYQQQAVQPPISYKFSTDELRVLKECNEESFYQRCVPLSTAFGFSAYIAVKSGILQPNFKYGATPKVALAVIVGYFLGKFSYQQKCAEKLMALPNSFIGQQLRSKQQGKFGNIGGTISDLPFGGVSSSDVYSDASVNEFKTATGPTSSLDIDTERPQFADNFYNSNDVVEKEKKPEITYDDLRRQHRSGYNDSRRDPYRVEPPKFGSSSQYESDAPTKPLSSNLYGDDIIN